MSIFLGCELPNPFVSSESYHIIEVTGLPVVYNEQMAYVSIGPETWQDHEIHRMGTTSDGKFFEAICIDNCSNYWSGFGEFSFVMMFGDILYRENIFISPGDDVFIYTNGKTFQELQIDVCSITGSINDLPSDLFDKLPKIEFHIPLMKNTITIVEFNKLQKLDYTGC
ncbi:MAG: hypothetical protein FWC26_05505 [Fibromonadales bacterium]|nr:hypothetical protein [Fibromonadales bacterium]